MIFLLISLAYAAHNIMDYGATPNVSGYGIAQSNAVAFTLAFGYAVKDPSDREIIVPADLNFYMLPVALSNATNVTITIDGNIWACDDYEHWPAPDGKHYENLFEFTDMTDFKV